VTPPDDDRAAEAAWERYCAMMGWNDGYLCERAAFLAGRASRASEPTPSAPKGEPNHYDRPPDKAEPFPNGTAEAIRDCLLRSHLFNCMENAGPKAIWYYAEALQIITAYRLELTAAKPEPPQPSDAELLKTIRAGMHSPMAHVMEAAEGALSELERRSGKS
jgi:hypothetical protein